jgi:hypothetical protein
MSAVSRRSSAPWAGIAGAAVLVTLSIGLPRWADWNVHVRSFPPIHAEWLPRVGPGTLPALIIAGAAVVFAPRVRTWRWRRLVLVSWLTSIAWLLSLATVDGLAGIDAILETDYEYLETARAVTEVRATLTEYVQRIPFDHPDNWPVHVAGHPPGALLFFYLLVQVGLGSGLAAGLVVIAFASTTPVAVMVTLRALGSEWLARKVAPLLVLSPAAIWAGVSADGMFAAVAAWSLAALALAVRVTTLRRLAWSLLSGLLLGYCAMLSYGLPLMALLAVVVAVSARTAYPLVIAAIAAAGVVLAFALLGYSWWEAYPVLRERYWDGVASRRPNGYWLWANFAALCFSAGPMVVAGLAAVVARGRSTLASAQTRPVAYLAAAAWLIVLTADVSLMSKGEVERIWLPFIPWLLVGCALLPERWRRPALVVQGGFALVVQHLFFTGW